MKYKLDIVWETQFISESGMINITGTCGGHSFFETSRDNALFLRINKFKIKRKLKVFVPKKPTGLTLKDHLIKKRY